MQFRVSEILGKFVGCLKSQGAYEAWEDNFKANWQERDIWVTVVKWIEEEDYNALLTAAFTWVDSPEGGDYWCDVMDAWEKIFIEWR